MVPDALSFLSQVSNNDHPFPPVFVNQRGSTGSLETRKHHKRSLTWDAQESHDQGRWSLLPYGPNLYTEF